MLGLLMVLADAPSGREAAFNRWYDQHARARLAVPGINTAQRYEAVTAGPKYMASYDLASLKVLELPAYVMLRENRPEGEQQMIDSLATPLDRRVYREIAESVNDNYSSDASIYAVAEWSTAGSPANFTDSFDQRPIPLHFKTRAWLRSRRFERVTGEGSQFLTLHELSSLADDAADFQVCETLPRGCDAHSRPVVDHAVYRLRERFSQ